MESYDHINNTAYLFCFENILFPGLPLGHLLLYFYSLQRPARCFHSKAGRWFPCALRQWGRREVGCIPLIFVNFMLSKSK